ncbi:MAG TPA: response regulator [Ktedonobacterales bacterium]
MSGTEGDQKHENNATPSQPEPALVLIAEDEEPIAEALAMIVEDCGYIPLVASNGRQALELARARHPSLVITDMMMPYMDGVELIALLHQDAVTDGYAPPPIILLSAAGLKRMRTAGADAFLSKPFDLDDLEGLLHRFLGPSPDAHQK